MKTQKKLHWAAKLDAVLFVALFAVIMQLAWGCTETDPKSRHNASVTDSPQLALEGPGELDCPFPFKTIMVLDSPEVLGLPCPGCPTDTFWRDTFYIRGEVTRDSAFPDCVLENWGDCDL